MGIQRWDLDYSMRTQQRTPVSAWFRVGLAALGQTGLGPSNSFSSPRYEPDARGVVPNRALRAHAPPKFRTSSAPDFGSGLATLWGALAREQSHQPLPVQATAEPRTRPIIAIVGRAPSWPPGPKRHKRWRWARLGGCAPGCLRATPPGRRAHVRLRSLIRSATGGGGAGFVSRPISVVCHDIDVQGVAAAHLHGKRTETDRAVDVDAGTGMQARAQMQIHHESRNEYSVVPRRVARPLDRVLQHF